MLSFQGIRLRYFALALSIIAIAAGVYLTFFRSNGFKKATATIVSIEELPKDFENEDTQYDVTVEYTVDGKEYKGKLDSYSPSYDVGKTVSILYDPSDPSVIHSGTGFAIYVLIVGIVIFVLTVISIVRGRSALKKLKETESIGKEAVYPPSVLGEERELYFITDIGTPKYGHRLEDANKKVLFEAKMTKYTLTAPFGFNFIDCENGKTTAHLVGHEEATEWNSLILDNHYTFKFDGEDIWKHLRRNGISVDSSLGRGSGKLIGTNYVILRDGTEIARAESTSQFVHEEDAANHSAARNAIPVKGFYRVWTKEENLELLFTTLVAFARTQASDDRGGNRKTLFNTITK